jgi:diketogulonate reductase-like aldo/keto reductase
LHGTRQERVLAIPKGSTPDHVRQNRGAVDVNLTRADLIELDRGFLPSARKVPLEII